MTRRLAAVILALGLAGCAEVGKQPPAAESPRAAAPATTAQPPAADASRLNDQVARIANELTELQNAVAKLIAMSRQQEDQLTYLRRRVEELESGRGRGQGDQIAFARRPRAGNRGLSGLPTVAELGD